MAAKIGLNRLEKSSKNVRGEQEKALKEILDMVGETEYAKQYGISKRTTMEELRILHPLVNGEHFAPFTQKEMDGERILVKEKPIYFKATSGTTGANKIYPITESAWKRHMEKLKLFAVASLAKINPWFNDLRVYSPIMVGAKFKKTKDGTLLGSGSAKMSKDVTMFSPFPTLIYGIRNEKSAMYVQALVLLGEPDLGTIECVFAPQCYSFFKTIEVNFPQICDDMKRGAVTVDVELEDDVRKKLRKYLKPLPERAEEVKKQCLKGTKNLAKRL